VTAIRRHPPIPSAGDSTSQREQPTTRRSNLRKQIPPTIHCATNPTLKPAPPIDFGSVDEHHQKNHPLFRRSRKAARAISQTPSTVRQPQNKRSNPALGAACASRRALPYRPNPKPKGRSVPPTPSRTPPLGPRGALGVRACPPERDKPPPPLGRSRL